MKIVLPIFFLLVAMSGVHAQQSSTRNRGVKDYYKDYFSVGVAVSPRALRTDEATLVRNEFNSITPENAMKMGPIHPLEDKYFWDDADSIVAFAQRHKMKVRGHTLCWHNQTPSWMFVDARGDTVSKQVLLKRLERHITDVVTPLQRKNLCLGRC